MSRLIKIDKLSDEQRKRIHKELTIKIESTFNSSGTIPNLYLYEIKDDNLYLPFSYQRNIPRVPKEEIVAVNYNFVGNLYEEQKEIQQKTIEAMNNTGSYIIAAYTGFGKSITSISIMSKIKYKTLIIINRKVLIDQWKESIEQFCPGTKVEYVEPNKVCNDADVYIMNAINIKKKEREFFKGIGFVIVDEIHLIMSKVLSECMFMVQPRFLLGLSATPYRTDGLNILIELFFGKELTYKPLYHPHKVYKVLTQFKPTIEKLNGRVNWSIVLESQANNIRRNEIIIDIVKKFNERVFLIICKRVSQAEYILERLREENEDVTSLIKSEKEYNKTSRILVGTSSKCGTGFNHPKLNTLILACDIVDYFIQYLGRIIRKKDVDVMVFDLVDDNKILEKHFKERKDIYTKAGGVIEEYKF